MRARARPDRRAAGRRSSTVLQRVVRGIADERLGVDHEPRLALGPQHVAGMEIGGEQNLSFGARGEGTEQVDALTGETGSSFARPAAALRS